MTNKMRAIVLELPRLSKDAQAIYAALTMQLFKEAGGSVTPTVSEREDDDGT